MKKYPIVLSFICSIIPLIITFLLLVEKWDLKDTSQHWRFQLTFIGFLIFLFMFFLVLSVYLWFLFFKKKV